MSCFFASEDDDVSTVVEPKEMKGGGERQEALLTTCTKWSGTHECPRSYYSEPALLYD